MKVQSKLGVTIPAPYKVYTALLTQSGTNAPVTTILENTTDFSLTWSYSDVGIYRAIVGGEINPLKTTISLLPENRALNLSHVSYYNIGIENSNLQVTINTGYKSVELIGGSIVSTPANGILFRNVIEIKVYP